MSWIPSGYIDKRQTYSVIAAGHAVSFSNHSPYLSVGHISNLPREPTDAADDVDFFGAALIGTVETVVRDHPYGGRIAVGHVLEPLGHQAHPVVQHEDPGRVGCAAGHVNQHGIAVQQRRRHAVAFDVHDA